MSQLLSLSNSFLTVTISTLGAELQSILDYQGREWLWQGNPEVWGKRAPLLFPFVGRLKENTYTYQEASYSMEIHGFAKTSEFIPTQISSTKVSFSLSSTESSKSSYPFDFELVITYFLEGTQCIKTHYITNLGNHDMYYELGGHDGFNLNFYPEDSFQDYTVELPSLTAISPYHFDERALLLPKSGNIPLVNNKLSLNFTELGLDCFVLDGLPEQCVTLVDSRGKQRLCLQFPDFPVLVLWAPIHPNPPFLCIEPWSSLPDCTFVGKDITDKIYIRKLSPKTEETLTYITEFFIEVSEEN